MSPLDRQAVLDEIGIVAWERRSLSPAPGPERGAEPETTDARLVALDAKVAGCRDCALHEHRQHTVFGVGNPAADCMIIGEAPGAEEDRRGEPFVGKAGRLLNAMLCAIGLDRDDVYIANIIKCRPPRNRDPEPAEVAACAGYLRAQIELVSPRVILAVGRFASQSLIGSQEPIGRLRGRAHTDAGSGVPLVATYHPAYLLRSPNEKRKTWDDLKRVRALLDSLEPAAK